MAVTRLGSAVSSTGTTVTLSIGAGSDRYLIVMYEGEKEQDVGSPPTADYGGQSMTQLEDSYLEAAENDLRVTFFGLNDVGIAAASTTTVTITGAGLPIQPTVHAAAYQGVHQATPVAQSATDQTANSTPNPITTIDLTVSDGSAVVAGAACGNATTATWQSDLTEQSDVQIDTNTGSFADEIFATGQAVTIECTWASQNRAVAASMELQQATGDTSATVTPGVIVTTVTVPAVTVVGPAIAMPGVIARSFALPLPVLAVPVTVAPSVIARSFTLPAPTVVGGAIVTPGTISRSFTLLSSTPVAPVTVAPGVIARSFTLPAPTVVGSAVATPGIITTVVGTPAATNVGPAVVSPGVVSCSFVLPAPTIIIGGGPELASGLLLMGVG